jgi:hypothetical protein
MALLKNVELWYPFLDPKRPNPKFNKVNPTWEVQGRTTDKTQKKEWEELGLPVKPVIPEDGAPYWRVNFKKRSLLVDGSPAVPVDVVDGFINPVDPRTIGNGSIGNIRIYQRNYINPETNEAGVAATLSGVQLTMHKVYTPKPFEDEFEETETKRIEPESTEPDYGDDVPF